MTPQDALVCQNVHPRPRGETLIDLLRGRAEEQPDRLAYRFLLDGEEEEIALTYGELDRRARAVGAWLRGHLPSLGRPVVLLHRPGLDFLAAFFGCLYGGAIAIPTYPPHPARRNRTASRLEAIVADAAPAAALTTSDLLPAVEPLMRRGDARPSGVLLAVDQLSDDLAASWTRPAITIDSLAMLQYTSGSTGAPNGVMISHGNLLHNSEQIRIFFEHTEDSQGLSWLPPYHDMGLIGGILQPLYAGFPHTLFSPLHFLQQPIRWLRAVTRWKSTSSGGPNFAYDLCVEKVSPEERAGLDLSSWDVAWNGAEPVRADTLDRFAAAFAPCGFRRQAFYPCYGLAEATLMVSGGVKADPPVIEHVEAERLENGQVVQAAAGTHGARSLVGCGRSIPEQEIILVDPERRIRCRSSQVGEIWVRGPSVTHGYWRRPEQTANTFAASLADTGDGPFLRTGDLGFLKDGELFVTGRLKDLIILDGRNLYPQDIERSVEVSHPAIRPGCSMAFSVDQGGVERLIVVAEVERTYWSNVARRGDTVVSAEWQPLFKAIRRAVSETHDARIADILLVRPASLPKTPSGKHQRRAYREALLRGTLPDILATD
jgi:acyl-CoA synthetase (AMP-forming)/AMP-acid ligase II